MDATSCVSSIEIKENHMASLNRIKKVPVFTFEGARAHRLPDEANLERAVMSCLLWENQFYESGEFIATRIKTLVHAVSLESAAAIAVKARSKMYLRHVPLLIVREMARHPKISTRRTADVVDPYDSRWVRSTLKEVIQRPDEITEFMAIYWADGKCPIAKQVKLGLSDAMLKFSEYSLAKYNSAKGAVKLRDVMFMTHVKPTDIDATSAKWDAEARKRIRTAAPETAKMLFDLERPDGLSVQEDLLKRLADDTLETPDTWEVQLSSGADKKETFTRLMQQGNLGGLAFLRNLRGMIEAGVNEQLIVEYGDELKFEKVLPFRFWAAAKVVPHLKGVLGRWMLRSTEFLDKLPGRTVFLVDVSGSMFGTKVSARSDLDRFDAAGALAMIGNAVCEDSTIYSFSAQVHKIEDGHEGFDLIQAIQSSQRHVGTYLGEALRAIRHEEPKYDRLIVITDEQSHDPIPRDLIGKKYVINVASQQNSIVNDTWVRINGWSENVIRYIAELEAQ
jgi:60 kDa SS-A/Ro ribonucleoprotein